MLEKLQRVAMESEAKISHRGYNSLHTYLFMQLVSGTWPGILNTKDPRSVSIFIKINSCPCSYARYLQGLPFWICNIQSGTQRAQRIWQAWFSNWEKLLESFSSFSHPNFCSQKRGYVLLGPYFLARPSLPRALCTFAMFSWSVMFKICKILLGLSWHS